MTSARISRVWETILLTITIFSLSLRRIIERQGASMNRSCITQRGLVLLLVVSTFCTALYAGFKPEQHVIVQGEIHGPVSVYAADLDGDGDLDVLSASNYDDKIAWYANDGMGHFGPQQVITTAAAGARSVYAADLDGDGDLDVLSASSDDDKIAWYENE
jgi:Na+/citrate or Na+/malate symporter